MADTPIDLSVLDYQEPTVLPPAQTTSLDRPDGLLPFSHWKNVGRTFFIKPFDDTTSPVVGDDMFRFYVPAVLDGATLYSLSAAVITASASLGPVSIQVRNASGDMLTTALTIPDTKHSSEDATATPSVVNPSNNVLRTDDLIHIDIDNVGDGLITGLQIVLNLQ